MTASQYAARKQREENMERVEAARRIRIDKERNLGGIKRARAALAKARRR